MSHSQIVFLLYLCFLFITFGVVFYLIYFYEQDSK